jgi:beta-glucuronidase
LAGIDGERYRQGATMNQTISLNGLWDFVVDLDPKYHAAANYAHPDWDRRHWRKELVPGVWNKYAERYDIFEGVGWFARTFHLPALTEGTTCLARFAAVNYLCDVFVNGQPIGSHEGGYTEFVLDVSRFVHEGDNTIALRVDNRALITKLPPVLGYFNYGGIHRDVSLEIYPGAYLADLGCNADYRNETGTLNLSGRVAAGAGTGCRVEVSCNGISASTDVAASGEFALAITVPDAKPWSPDHPALYNVQVTLRQDGAVSDVREFETGFRTLRAVDNRIELNDTPIDFRGICYLYDSPTYGLVMHREQYELDLALLRELGVNAIRSHFAFPHDFLTACDRAGLMVWIEPPVYCIDPKLESCRTAFTDPAWRSLALTMLEEGIRQSKLHPSVCIYGIGNECNLGAPGADELIATLATRAKELDPSRLISYACLYGLAGRIAEMVDVVGFNEYWGWYDVLAHEDPKLALSDTGAPPERSATRAIDLRKLETMLSEQAAILRRPVFLTEFGADSIPGYRSAASELWSEDYHADVLRETFAIVDRMPFICGTFPFVFADYRDPSKEINAYWDELNYKGVVSYARRPKAAFATLREEYANRRSKRDALQPES